MKRIILLSILVFACSFAYAQSLPNVAFPTSEAVADTYTVNITNYGSSYNDKVALINFRTANGGPATLNITPSGGSALGARPLRKFDGTDWVPLESGDIRGDSSLYLIHYSANCGCLRMVPQGTGSGGGGGSVNSVVGTTNRITSTGGTDPAIDISATFEALLGKVAQRIDQNNASTTSAQLASVLSDEEGSSGGFTRSDYVVGTQDLFVSAAAMWPRTTGGCSELTKTEIATSLFNIQTLLFDQSTDEFAQFQVVLPRKYNSSTVTVVIYWTAASGTGDVIWSVNGGAYSNDDALSTALGSAQSVTDALITTNDLHVTSATSAITLAGTPADADMLAFQISRDADNGSDTLNADAKLLGISIRITTDAAKDN